MDGASALLSGPLAQESEDIAMVVPGVVGLAGAFPEVPIFQAPLPPVLTAPLAGSLYAPPVELPLPRIVGALLGRAVVHFCSERVLLFEELGAPSVDKLAHVSVAGVVPVSA